MTANYVTVTKHGVCARFAAWDCVSDYVLMKSPDLISWGERVMQAGFSSVWLANKLPCFISQSSRYIIIFVVEGVLPFWSPFLEESLVFVGTFACWHNRVRDCCGVFIDDYGQVCVTVQAPYKYRKECSRITASVQSMRPGQADENQPSPAAAVVTAKEDDEKIGKEIVGDECKARQV